MMDSKTIHRLLLLLCYAIVMAIVIIKFGVSLQCEIESLLVFFIFCGLYGGDANYEGVEVQRKAVNRMV